MPSQNPFSKPPHDPAFASRPASPASPSPASLEDGEKNNPILPDFSQDADGEDDSSSENNFIDEQKVTGQVGVNGMSTI